MTTIQTQPTANGIMPTTTAAQPAFTIDSASSDADIQGILDLQVKNLPKNITKEEAESQGFVTLQHDFELLKRMNAPYPHVVAREPQTNKIIGYALVMLPEFRKDIPIAAPMVDQVDSVVYEGDRLGNDATGNDTRKKYVLVGQLCVAKEYRGQGISSALYREYQRRMEPYFHYVVTAVDPRNTRSMRAHETVGFREVHRFGVSATSHGWVILLLPTTATSTVKEDT